MWPETKTLPGKVERHWQEQPSAEVQASCHGRAEADVGWGVGVTGRMHLLSQMSRDGGFCGGWEWWPPRHCCCPEWPVFLMFPHPQAAWAGLPRPIVVTKPGGSFLASPPLYLFNPCLKLSVSYNPLLLAKWRPLSFRYLSDQCRPQPAADRLWGPDKTLGLLLTWTLNRPVFLAALIQSCGMLCIEI